MQWVVPLMVRPSHLQHHLDSIIITSSPESHFCPVGFFDLDPQNFPPSKISIATNR